RTAGVVSFLWTDYLQTIPSLSIVELKRYIQKMKMSDNIPAQFEVLSRPIGPKKTVCHYRTTQELTLNPMTIVTVK
ncbi:type VI secretion system baseplate subunit TssF, partial [Proteus mirabilis]|uniref:type VI secretion system baseplate subunit TssF n=1 Tax=Proteus mirabilis TaxID=584 RepID=UPI00391CBD26